MDNPSSSADKILYLLKTSGPMTAKDLADKLNMTPMGARQHLLQMQKKQWVTSFHQAEKVGRPNQYWNLTSKAQNQFPDTHEVLTTNLLESTRQVFGEEGLLKVIKHREQTIREHYKTQLDPLKSISEKLDVLAKMRSKEGYMAAWYKEAEDYFFTENHCPICAAAKECQQLCSSELDVLQDCFQGWGHVTREQHMLSGERRCLYRIEPVEE